MIDKHKKSNFYRYTYRTYYLDHRPENSGA
jgi:hypothetical protein